MKILLATDGSVHAAHAERLAASIAWPAGSSIEALAVTQLHLVERDFPVAAALGLHEEIDRRAEEQLRSVRRALEREGREVGSRRRSGRPGEVIVDEAAAFGADLIVVGSRGRGLLASALLGSVAAEVVDHAACPVLVARTDVVRALVLADDGSPAAAHAAAVVTGWGAFAALPHHVVAVADLAFFGVTMDPVGPGLPVNERAIEAIEEYSRRVASDGAARLRAKGLRVAGHSSHGFVTQALIGAAARLGADLIVVGSRGNTGLKRAALGSVARGVLLGAPCSVLVVKPRA